MTTPTTISEVRAELERRADVTEEAQRLTKSAPMLTALVMRADALREAAALLSAAEAREGALREALAQYRDDLKHPPSPDSIDRRLAWISTLHGEQS